MNTLSDKNKIYRMGIDIGSTTIKIAVLDEDDTPLYKNYRRHYADIRKNMALLLEEAGEQLGDVRIRPVITVSG